MLELNKVMIVGRLTRDPETMYAANGNAIVKIAIAVNRRGFGDREDETHFFDVTAFGQSAEFVSKYFSKGKAIYVEGRLNQDRWTDRETGGNRSKIVIIAERVQFAESRSSEQGDGGGWQGGQSASQSGPQGQAAPAGGNAPSQQAPAPENTEDDLPF